VQEIAGSNPVAPTMNRQGFGIAGALAS